jgi:MerR family transcriptional regulator, light-induced transcriptional regulator
MENVSTPLPLSSFSDEPVYNVKAVCNKTGITAATLRAWERRYGLPQPDRSGQGYRLYSDRDVAILFWLMSQVENNISIGQAVAQLNNLLGQGQNITVRIPAVASTMTNVPRSPETLTQDLFVALQNLDERLASQYFDEALALYSVETLWVNIVRPTVNMLRTDAEHIPITVQRYALNHLRNRVTNFIQNMPVLRGVRPIATIGFPGEHNELDILILGLLIRRQGAAVAHLGTDLSPELLADTLHDLQPLVVLYYTDTPANASRLRTFPEQADIRLVIVGDALAKEPELQDQIPFAYLGNNFRYVAKNLGEYFSQNFRVRVPQPVERKDESLPLKRQAFDDEDYM